MSDQVLITCHVCYSESNKENQKAMSLERERESEREGGGGGTTGPSSKFQT